MEYGVKTQNKYAFLGDDEEVTDPEEVLQRAEKESKEKPKVAAKDVKKPVVPEKKVTIVSPPASKDKADGRGPPPRRDQKRGPRAGGFMAPRGPRRSTGDENTPPGDVMGDRFGETRPRTNNRRSQEGDNTGEDRGWKKNDRPRQHRGGDNYVSGDSDNQNRPPRGDRPIRRGPRGDRSGPPRGDRQSGDPRSGPRPGGFKKGGHGSANWGTEQDDLAAETQPNATVDSWGSESKPVVDNWGETPKADDWGAPAAENQEVPQEATDAEKPQENGEDVEVEKITLTLQEWKAQQNEKQKSAQFNVRKAGEGGDQKVYKNLVPIKKEKVEKDANTTEDEDEHLYKREPRERPLNIAISFNDPNRGGGRSGGYHRGDRDHREDRGGYRGGDREDRPPRQDRGDRQDRPPRGGAGGGGGRGGDRGPRRQFNQDRPSGSGRRQNQGQDFNFTQESFPALGAR